MKIPRSSVIRAGICNSRERSGGAAAITPRHSGAATTSAKRGQVGGVVATALCRRVSRDPLQTSGRRFQNSSGMALVIVLGMLVLVLILVIAFFSSVSVDLQSAKRYSSGTAAKTLADSAVSLVISQIQDATAAPNLAWASQPGMIRTYNDQGAPVTAFKLYSSNQLRVDGGFGTALQAAEVPGDWAGSPTLFTDLNRPVAVAGGNHYPILDPAAVAKDVSGGTAVVSGASPIEGCFLDTGNAATTTSATQTNPVPMPVQWMYVLESGKLAAMDSTTKIIAGASTADPIVGRIAFWTDDETSKVNINTASEGTFWDRPWTSSNPAGGYEASLYQKIPAQNEFQRFPGHPAMTCLSPVFPPLTGESEADYNARIYGIIPRVSDGGSRSGTQTVNYQTPPITSDGDRLFASVDEFLFQVTNNASSTNPRGRNLKGPSTEFDETDIEKTRFFLTASSRSPEVNMFNKPRITLWPLQIDPEPGTGIETRNSKDKLIAFCSTIGSGADAKPYFFQRYNTYNYSSGGPNIRSATGPYTPTQDPKPSSQSPVMDWSEIPRNRELYTYLQSLTRSPIPGLGGKLAGSGSADKYTLTTRDQILTQMLDYVRSNVNLTSAGIKTTSGVKGYSYAPFSPTTGAVIGQFQIVPLSLPNGTKGFGQFPTITQAALVFFRTDNVLVDGTEQTVPVKTYNGILPVTAGSSPKMRAFLILQPFTTTPGPPPWSANLRIQIEGLQQFLANGVPLSFPANAVNLITARDGQSNATPYTGLELFTQFWPLKIKQPGLPSVGSTTEEEFYPFVSGEIPLSGTSFGFTGGKITIRLLSGYAQSLEASDLVQTIEMDFPNGTGWPIPDIAYSRSTSNAGTPADPADDTTTVTQFNEITTRFGATQSGGPGIQQNGQHNPLPLIRSTDTVRAVEARYGGPARGDYRMIAGLQNVPDSFFEGRGLKDTPSGGKSYTDSAVASRLLHSLRVDSGAGQGMTSFSGGYYAGAGVAGKLLASATYYTSTSNPNKAQRSPAVPFGLAQAEMTNGLLGDWDTGIGNRRDGPFTNKADLGNVGSNLLTPNGYYSAQGVDRSSNNAVFTDIGASFSPNRQISSAVSFGSLPTGIDPASPNDAKPWQTTLFCKNPLAGIQHPGFGKPVSGTVAKPPYSTPPDHAFLDLFTMPIVEPYAISEPFSTAGKVNMNYQIMPFTYVFRNTGVRAVLKATRMMAIPTARAINYKYDVNSGQSVGAGYPPDFRYLINPDEENGTLAGFEQRFASGDIFRSASEICDIYLVPGKNVDGSNPPGSPTYDTMASWWLGSSTSSPDGFKLTGDNVREGPYGHIYPRLTTKSNTFTVHVQAQSIAKSRVTPADEFIEGKDQITGEFRGSFLIERYLDPNSDSLVKADGKTATDELDSEGMVGPYKFRVVSTKKFAP